MDSPTGSTQPPSAPPPSSTLGPSPDEIDPLKLQDFVRRRRDAQNLSLGILGGVIGAAIGAALWAGITAATKYEIGFMAVGVGFLTGFGVRYLGKGMDPIFGFVGAILSLAGCLAGNLLAIMFFVSTQEHIPFGTIVARMSPDIAWTMLVKTFSPIDLLFYGLALYFGYRYSFHPITHEELESLKS